MSTRVVVNVATGRYIRGQERLTEKLSAMKEDYSVWSKMPYYSPSHAEIPYAFKAHALKEAERAGGDVLLWADACILPIAPLGPLWERIERDGYWIGSQAGPEPDQGYTNYEWTAETAYPDLFGRDHRSHAYGPACLASDRALNRKLPHVVATTFGFSLEHPTGRAILEEYYRLARTKAFCGPWVNTAWPGPSTEPIIGACGPADVRGHRHDQTALSVIAWRMGCKLTRWPDIFAYRGHETDQTILVADGNY